jgi:hypothetical protein
MEKLNPTLITHLVKDWGGFEKLVAKLHETGDVAVEHNATLVGRSGASRQIDVLIRHKQGLYEHLVIAECKYWNSPVERLHVDALATTVREVGASKGVIFSTKGFQSGAITQAAHDSIDLFTVRELTDEEWGLPGRVFDMYLHVNSISIGNIQLHGAFSIPGSEPSNPHLDLHLGNPATDSKTPIAWEGKPDTTLEEMIYRIARESAPKGFVPTPVQFKDGFDGAMRFRMGINIQPTTPIRISISNGVIFVPRITFDIGVTILQSRVHLDRAANYLFALAIEDCVQKNIVVASRHQDKDTTSLLPLQTTTPSSPEEIYKNGSLMTVWVSGFQSFEEFNNIEPGKMVIFDKLSNPT